MSLFIIAFAVSPTIEIAGLVKSVLSVYHLAAVMEDVTSPMYIFEE